MPVPVPLLTADAALIAAIRPLAAAAGATLDVDADAAAGFVAAAPLILLGPDVARTLAARGWPRWSAGTVVLVSTDLDDAGVWQLAAEAGAEFALFLPDGEEWLAGRLADVAAGQAVAPPALPAPPGGVCVGVLSGRGGAGGTVLATVLATRSIRRGLRTCLIDADPLGGGIGLGLGGGSGTAGASGGRPLQMVADCLPGPGELAAVSWERAEDIPVRDAARLLDACIGGSDLVVVDLPRHLDDAAGLVVSRSDAVCLLVPAEVRACSSASRVALGALGCGARLGLVVRGPGPAGLRPTAVAEALGLPLWASYRSESAISAALERGEAPALAGRSPLGRACERLLDRFVAGR